ncbi:hypothetical protein [Variovorax ginsengisoli]|uniref:Uncharacterized protein n=1 Tax=Variovorax ginsengisoli TaxID=363844 RepID=A0ABT9S3X1_9BURK|nr:hypothetical protein [Variovorax ginsengisoli]MDP9899037.1 hypothetical protein [Variovorax ginsengisoli]
MPTLLPPEPCQLWIASAATCVQTGDWSGWFHVVASVVAIVGVFLWSEQRARAWRRADGMAEIAAEERRADTVLAVARGATERAERMGVLFEGDHVDMNVLFDRYDESILSSLMGTLDSVPVHEIGSARAAAALLDMRDTVRLLRKTIQTGLETRRNASIVEAGGRPQFDAVFCKSVRDQVSRASDAFGVLQAIVVSDRRARRGETANTDEGDETPNNGQVGETG